MSDRLRSDRHNPNALPFLPKPFNANPRSDSPLLAAWRLYEAAGGSADEDPASGSAEEACSRALRYARAKYRNARGQHAELFWGLVRSHLAHGIQALASEIAAQAMLERMECGW